MAKAKQTEEGVQKDDVQNKNFGKGTAISGKNVQSVKSIPTGSITLDIATNINGLPIGKLIEIFGPESSGKSTLTMHFIAEFQKAGKKCMLVDAEHSFDTKYATSLGVNVDELIYCQPDCMEDAYNIMETSIRSGILGLIIFDSHTSSQPKKIVEGEVGEATMAIQARLNSTALGKLHPILDKYNVTMVGISQIRQNIGGYGDPNVTTGGLSWKFYTDMRMKVSKKVDKTGSSNRTIVEIIKNKCGVPFGKAEFSIIWGQGIDRQQELIDLAVQYGFLKLGGAGWYTITEDIKIQGDEKLKVFLVDNPDYAKELENNVMNNAKSTYESKSEETDTGSSNS